MLFLLLFYWFLGYFSPSVLNRTVLTLALGLATPILPYSQNLYSHVPCAALLFAAFVLLFLLEPAGRARGHRSRWLISHPHSTAFLAGLALGSAVLFDYEAVVIALVIGLYALWRLPRSLSLSLVAGALPGLVALAAYDVAAYHNPLRSAYSVRSSGWTHVGEGVAGTAFTWPPHLAAIIGMSVSPYRGVFFLSPFLLLALPGFVWWARSGRREWLLFLTAPLALFLFIAMDAYWAGGYSVGSRILIPALPFLAVPVILVLDRVQSVSGRIGVYVLLCLSLFNVWIQTVGGRGYPPTHFANPLFQYSLPNLVHGTMPLSLGTILIYPFVGMDSKLTLLPLLALIALGGITYAGLVRIRKESGPGLS
jgi:hypothetical protein